jgi:hypothetical protein
MFAHRRICRLKRQAEPIDATCVARMSGLYEGKQPIGKASRPPRTNHCLLSTDYCPLATGY